MFFYEALYTTPCLAPWALSGHYPGWEDDLKPGWIFPAWLLVAWPLVASAQTSLQSACQEKPCVVVTAGNSPTPSASVEGAAGHLLAAEGWSQLRDGLPVSADQRDVEPFRHLLVQARATYGDQEKDLAARAEEVRRMLHSSFFSALPDIAPWQDLELQVVLAKLCDQLIAVTPKTDQVVIARTCLVHLPDLRAQIIEGKGAGAFEGIYQRALGDRAKGHLELVTDGGCEIAVAGVRTPSDHVFLSDPLPGRYNVVVYCGSDRLLFHLDAYAELAGGRREIYLASRARLHLRPQASGVPHFEFKPWQSEAVYRAARDLLAENRLAGVVVVHAEPQLTTELVRQDSVVHLATITAPSASASSTSSGQANDRPRAARQWRKPTTIAMGALGAGAIGAAWGLAIWSSSGPVQTFIDSGHDPSLAQPDYDRLESEWRTSRVALHSVGAVGLVSSELALALGRARLRRWPAWTHWAIGGAGLALTTFGVIEVVRSSGCDDSDPRKCADRTYNVDRGTLLLFTGLPLLSEPLLASPWKPLVAVDASTTHATLSLRWRR
jgi:hypothetical protein